MATALQVPKAQKKKSSIRDFKNRKRILSLNKAPQSPNKETVQFSSSYSVANQKKLLTTNIKDVANIKVQQDDWDPITVAEFVLEAVKQWNDRGALGNFGPDGWAIVSYVDYKNEIFKAARAFIALGLKKQESVAFTCFNSQFYFIYTLATIFAGGVFVNIPNHENRSRLFQILEECKVNIVIVGTYRQANDVKVLVDKLESLKAIVMADQADPGSTYQRMWTKTNAKALIKLGPRNLLHRSDLEAIAEETPFQVLMGRITNLSPDRCCAVFYPIPQDRLNACPMVGVMYSHDNLTYMARLLGGKLIDERYNQEHHPDIKKSEEFRIVSYLPFNTPFVFIMDILVPMTAGGLVCFAKDDALKGTLVHTLRDVRPTIFLGNKKVWCLFQRRLTQRTRRAGRIQRSIIGYVRKKALFEFYRNQIDNKNPTLKIKQPSSLVRYITAKVKRTFGIDQCGMFISHEGHPTIETLEFFLSFDIPLFDTLTSPYLAGPHAMGSHGDYLIGSVGWELPSLTSKLIPMNNFSTLYAHGRHVCMGVISHIPQEAMYERQLIYTGVTVYRSDIGFLHVPSLSQNVIVLQNDTEVKYIPVEKAMKETLPIISRCILFGHGKKFPVVLITLKTEMEATGRPTTKLSKGAQRWLKQRGVDCRSIEEMAGDKLVYEIIEDAVITVNSRMKQRSCRIKRWRVLPFDFSVLDGDLDPLTLQLRREKIEARYWPLIRTMYAKVEDKYRLTSDMFLSNRVTSKTNILK